MIILLQFSTALLLKMKMEISCKTTVDLFLEIGTSISYEDFYFRSCVDTSPYEDEQTTIADMPLMEDFVVKRQVSCFSSESEYRCEMRVSAGFNFCFVFDDEIVTKLACWSNPFV